VKYRLQAFSHRGNYRKNNEDAVGYGVEKSRGFCWLALADGMGGHKAGEVASELAIETIRQALENSRRQPSLSLARELLSEANQAIYDQSQCHEAYAGMGTTCVLVLCIGATAYVAWVGDSRCYHWRDGQLTLCTRDHSMLHYLVDKGAMTEEEAEQSSASNILARALGIKSSVQVDGQQIDLQPGDRLLLSSDGLHGVLSEAQLQQLVTDETDQTQSQRWLEAALSAGSRDNISYVFMSLSN